MFSHLSQVISVIGVVAVLQFANIGGQVFSALHSQTTPVNRTAQTVSTSVSPLILSSLNADQFGD